MAEDRLPPDPSLVDVMRVFPRVYAEVGDLRKAEVELQLRFDLYRVRAEADSSRASLELGFTQDALAAAESRRMRWYQEPSLWLSVGVVLGVLITGSAFSITF